MMRKRLSWVLAVLGWMLGVAPGCSTDSNGQGGETCGSDADCRADGANFRCVAKRCVASDSGSQAGGGGSGGGHAGTGGGGVSGIDGGGSGGTLPTDGGAKCEGGATAMPSFELGGACNSPGGAIGYSGCTQFVASGLTTISCAPDGGGPTKPPLADLCEHMDEVLQIFEQRIVYDCVQQKLGLAHGVFFHPDGSTGGFGGSATFDVAKNCDPGVTDALRQCVNSILPCPRLPMCTDQGSYGCDDIVASCPGLAKAACRNGFDSRDFAGRERIRECLNNDAGDCVAAFYRCAWGL